MLALERTLGIILIGVILRVRNTDDNNDKEVSSTQSIRMIVPFSVKIQNQSQRPDSWIHRTLSICPSFRFQILRVPDGFMDVLVFSL